MKINYVNDIHLDFWVYDSFKIEDYRKKVRLFVNKMLNNTEEIGEILIISGDLGHDNLGNLFMLEKLSETYEKIVITYGNHDLYLLHELQGKYYENSHFRVKEMYEIIKTNLGDKVHFLGEDFDGVLEYKGLRIGGDIMISQPQTIEEILFYKQRMNDRNYIKLDRYQLFLKNLRYYDNLKDEHLDIFVSHYPLILTDSHIKYNTQDQSKASLGSYLTEVTHYIARINLFGHVHERGIYKKKSTNKNDKPSMFLTHAIGYKEEGLFPSFAILDTKEYL